MPENNLFDELHIFAGLDAETRASINEEFTPLSVKRGEVLIRQGDEADALFITVSGRFSVHLDGVPEPITEIGPGQPIGELAFLGKGVRTATVIALRDSLVLKLGNEEFEHLMTRSPSLWRPITVSLAQRIADHNKLRSTPPDTTARTLTIIRAGQSEIPPSFIASFADLLASVPGADGETRRKVVTIDSTKAVSHLPNASSFDSATEIAFLNQLELKSDFVVYIADNTLTKWSDKAIRQADMVLAVGVHTDCPQINDLEQRTAELLPASAVRLALLHPRRQTINGTKQWLAQRKIKMHHHIAMDTPDDLSRLIRFIKGTALGLVASGGGALCSAQTGLYQALREIGISFDMVGGTSGGAAISGAIALGLSPQEIDDGIHEMFVKHPALRRLTVPRYSLIDHTLLDKLLATHYGETDIEDLWIPCFAASANLSNYRLQIHQRGSLWKAVRASTAIPAVLPPFYTAEGEMLVDGCVQDNVPIQTMHEQKRGPNIIMSFAQSERERFDVDYDKLPSRWQLLKRAINPLRSKEPFSAPGLVSVLTRSLLSNRHEFKHHLLDGDLMVVPPLPAEIGFLDWHRHTEMKASAYQWCQQAFQQEGGEERDWLLRTGLPSRNMSDIA